MECAKFPKVLVGSCKNVRSLESGDEPAFNSGGASLQLWGSKPSTVGEEAHLKILTPLYQTTRVN